jgi:hypothetical protein
LKRRIKLVFFQRSYSLVARGLYPIAHLPGTQSEASQELAEQALPYVAKAKSAASAVKQFLEKLKSHGGVTFAIYHITGRHSPDELLKAVKAGAFVLPEPVWLDKDQLKVYDLLADYYIGEGKFKQSRNDRLKLTAFTISDAVTVARKLIGAKGGKVYAVHHIIGNQTIEELEDIEGGNRKSVARLVWFDEDEALSSLTYEEVMEALDYSEAMTREECLAVHLLYDMSGPDSPGMCVPPIRPRREYEF